MQSNNSVSFKGLSARRAGQPLFMLVLALGVSACSKGADSLRSDIPATGVAATVQVNLPDDQQAQVAATVYKDAVAQPLVGGDVLQARTDQSLVTLTAEDNLSGHYSGELHVDHPDATVDIAINYDQEASAENRWFGSDDLLVNPGPGSLVGYAVSGMNFPPSITFESPLDNARYVTTADEVMVNWAPVNEGHQVRLAAAVACRYANHTYHYSLTHYLGIEGEDDTADGSYSLTIGELVQAAPLIATLANVQEYMSVFVTAVLLGVDPNQLLSGEQPDLSPGPLYGCDIDLTLFREQDNPLPAAFSGGYAITSRSDTVRITYAP